MGLDPRTWDRDLSGRQTPNAPNPPGAPRKEQWTHSWNEEEVALGSGCAESPSTGGASPAQSKREGRRTEGSSVGNGEGPGAPRVQGRVGRRVTSGHGAPGLRRRQPEAAGSGGASSQGSPCAVKSPPHRATGQGQLEAGRGGLQHSVGKSRGTGVAPCVRGPSGL